MTGEGVEVGALAARTRAAAVLRVRGRAVACAALPAAVAVVLWAAAGTGRLTGPGWDVARDGVSAFAVLVLLLAGATALLIARAAPAQSPTVPVAERSAPDLYRLVRELAEALDVPAPSAIALTPDCDSWLEERGRRGAAGTGGDPGSAAASSSTLSGSSALSALSGSPGSSGSSGSTPPAPVLVIGSPFLWWMRVAELRALLAPVVAGTGPAAHPGTAAARRFVRGLDAAVAVAGSRSHPVRRLVLGAPGRIARLLLVRCRDAASDMERYVAAASAERARAVDYGQRIVAQEQVGLAYAGWDRLLTRVAVPAWRMGRWPSRLDAGVVAALTELSRRDRLADGFAARLDERPACDLLEEPGLVDEAASLLAARLFHGDPTGQGSDWSPVSWQEYPQEVVDRTWRRDAARLHAVLDALDTASAGGKGAEHADDGAVGPEEPYGWGGAGGPDGPRRAPGPGGQEELSGPRGERGGLSDPRGPGGRRTALATAASGTARGLTLARVLDRLSFRDALPESGHGPAGSPERARTTPPGQDPGRSASSSGSPSSGTSPSGTSPSGGSPAPTSPASASSPVRVLAPRERRAEETRGGEAARGRTVENGLVNGPAGGPVEGSGDGFATASAHSSAGGPETDTEAVDAEAVSHPPTEALAAGLAARLAREEAAAPVARAGAGDVVSGAGGEGGLPLFPLQSPRTGKELLTDHVTALVCCAAVDTAGAAPGLDWLDGPALLVEGERAKDLGARVRSLVEDGDSIPLRRWLARLGIRPEKPIRLA
ncbi:hypothetical protein [Streptomyces sp. NPDC007088]|uniref:hypothetical protein n=1 Tax=Streptomyces sp. NPDC007088 TaxID=3364773 RepID=UPI0036B4EE13